MLVPALLLLAVCLALADASIVTLALPPIAVELGASVEQLAAVLGSYALVLALALPAAAVLRERIGSRAAAAGGLALLGLGSLGCGLAGSVAALVGLRAVQALGAAPLLVGAFALLDAGGRGRRAWAAATILGAAAGPALGGALTQLADWRAVFLVQVPVALGAAVVARAAPAAARGDDIAGAPAAPRARPLLALGLLSAALVGVLFLLVLLLVAGLSLTPLAAAAVVSVLPLAALAGTRVAGPPDVRAAAGAVLVAGGVGALALLPGASAWWTVAPQAVAGLGMGLALPALAGGLVPERTPVEAARLLSVRQAGVVLALALLAPLAANRLDHAAVQTPEREAAIVLDARLPPLDKLDLVRGLVGAIDARDPRGSLMAALPRAGGPEVAALRRRADDTLVAAVLDAFAPAFAVCAALALLAAVAALPPAGRRRAAGVAAAAAAALLVAAALVRPLRPEPARIADPCRPRALPSTGGIGGALQDAALAALDRAACRWGSSREELALALADPAAARVYERRHGVDPRDLAEIVRGVL